MLVAPEGFVVAIRRLPLAVLFAASVSACIAQPAPTPIAAPVRTDPPPTPAATATPQPTVAATPTPTPRPASGFYFRVDEILAYYEQRAGFACDAWQTAAAPGYQTRACRQADVTNSAGDQLVTLTIDPDGALADILASYAHRDGSSVDRGAAMRFFATVLGASFGGPDGKVAATWLTGNLGTPSAALDLRGLRFGTFLSDLPEDRGSALFIEIATPAFTAAVS
jgi:hypothetical protein